MMTNLFSIFDPSTYIFNFSLNWISAFLSFFFIPFYFWLLPSRLNFIWNKILTILYLEFKLLLKNKKKGNIFIFISLFYFILFNNFLGLFPYVFTASSHLSFCLTFALPLWISFMIFGWFQNTNHMFIHLVPQNTPFILMPFMVLIESISNIIRPGTLAVRLTANMIAGHLLLTLMSSSSKSMTLMFIYMLVILQIILLLLESAVSVIQAYVFSILSILYSSETN